MRRGLLAGVVSAVAMTTLLIVPGVAGASWTAPLTLSGANAGAPQVAVNSDGDAAFAWGRTDGSGPRIEGRTRRAGGPAGPVQTIAYVGRLLDVGVDSHGDAFFAWRGGGAHHRLCTRVLRADGTLSPIQTISAQAVFDAHVAVNAPGDAAYVWQLYSGSGPTVQGRVRHADDDFGPIRILSTTTGYSDSRVAIDSEGNAVFAWTDGGVQSRTLAANGTLLPIRRISPPNHPAVEPAVALNSTGEGVFAWSLDLRNGYYIPQARTRGSRGGLGPVRTLSRLRRYRFLRPMPQAAVDSNGDAVFAWSDDQRLRARALSSGGVLSPEQFLTPQGDTAAWVEVASGSTGNAVFAWEDYRNSGGAVEARTRTVGGVLSPTETISGTDTNVGAPELGADRNGNATVAWIGGADYDHRRMKAAFGP